MPSKQSDQAGKAKKPVHEKESPTSRWISYRPEIKVLDCTIRDGGLMNNHHFDDRLVRAVYDACVSAGIDYMEIGYKASRKNIVAGEYGAWKYCTEEDIRRIVEDKPGKTKISVMADAERCDYREDILPREQSAIDLVRVATYINQIPVAMDMIKDAHDKGYETTVNIMAASVVQDRELNDALEVLAQSPVDVIYVVDSFGSLYAEQIERLVKKYQEYTQGTGKQIGIHAHNNQQLAFANTIEAIIHGANLVDATMGGLGRGAGNCPMELLIGFLRNPKFKIRPIYSFLQDHIEPLREQVEWGPYVQYNITGQLNQHPRSAIAARADVAERGKYAEFYDKLTVDD